MEQLSIFDLLAESKPLPSNIKLLSLFSGIGAFEKALDNLGVGYELVNYCEIDKYASKSYSAIHGVSEDKNLWDVTKVDEKALPKDIDLITYGFPCQDISLAGKQKGLFNDDGSKTRSGLFFDALRIIEETKPRVAIAENVKNLVGKKFNAQFQVVLASLEAAGYNNYWQVLNSKDYGVPQNRERVFIVSIRKDIDKGYTFPKGFPLEKRLKDVLEETVDEKYYLSGKMVDYLATITEKNKARGNGNVYSPSDVDGVSKTITTKEGSRVKDNFIEEPTIHQVGQIYPNSGNPQAGRIYDAEGISPTMDTCSGGNRMPKVVEPFISIDEDSVKVRVANKRGYDEAHEGDSINLEQPNSKTRRGRVGKQVAQTLITMPQQAVVEPKVIGGIGEKKSNGGKQWYQQDRVDDDGVAISVTTGFQPYYATQEPMAYDEQNGYIRNDGTVGTLTTDGSSPKHNNRVLVPFTDESVKPSVAVNFEREKQQIVNSDKEIYQCECNSSWQDNKVGLKVSPTLRANNNNTFAYTGLRIRKLTPLECFRLMGFDDFDFHKAELVNSNTQLYKQAGNSIVVDVLEHLLSKALKVI